MTRRGAQTDLIGNIINMEIGSHLKKEFIVRRIEGSGPPPRRPRNAEYYEYPECPRPDEWYLTQEDLKREIESSAHAINSKYQSTRPIKELKERTIVTKDEDGNEVTKTIQEWVVTGYDELETTRFGLQKRFAIAKTAHMAADGFWIAMEGVDVSESAHRDFDILNSWKDTAGLDTMWLEIVSSCNHTTDAGVYLYVDDETNDITYKVYSYDDGYVIFPDIDENRKPMYFVLYSLKGKKAVDWFTVDGVSTWISGLDDTGKSKADSTWWQKVRNWFKSDRREVSEDGWVKVDEKESQVPKGMGQFFYFRVPDIPSGIAQLDIEGAERSASFVSEGVKSATFDTLFVKATSIESLPPMGSHGSVLAVKGDPESLSASDAKRIAPSDISNVATIDMKNKMDSILHSTMSVIVEPDILRSGADSSSAMRLCFVSEIQWCQTQWKYYFHSLRSLMNCFKYLVAKVERKPEIASLKISVGQNIWIPANRGELVDQTTKMVYAGMLSAEAGTHEVNLQYPNDMEQIQREQERKIYRETYIKMKAEADARRDFGIEEATTTDDGKSPDSNPTKPGVDNNADNK